MSDPISVLAALARELSHKRPLEGLLQLVVDAAAAIVAAPRASVRLFDVTRTRLIATCRAGEPSHWAPHEFRMGEGLIGWIAEHAVPLTTGDAPADPRFVERPDLREPIGSFVGVPLVSNNVCFGVISAVRGDRNVFGPRDEERLVLLAGLCAPHLEMARLTRLAVIDPLTGVFNRRGLDLVLPAESEGEVSVAMCDLDRFKSINDQFGHAAGDEVLRRVARLLATVIRSGDGVIRWGGEEFLLVLPGVELGRARRVVERARSWVENEAIELQPEHLVPVTISVGVAQRRAGEPRETLIARADEALYAAKNAGRNRVELAA
jgi:diguanylate cyclase (GGDEF)-like protein